MKIAKVILHNFRSFKDQEITFKDFNCIVGKNDVGKSTIFTALDWFFGNIELTDEDFNVDYVELYESDQTNSRLNEFYMFDELSVEIVFDGTKLVPNLVEETKDTHFYLKEFFDKEGNIHIKRYLLHSHSFQLINNDESSVKTSGYLIQGFFLEGFDTLFSSTSIKMLKKKYLELFGDIKAFISKFKDDWEKRKKPIECDLDRIADTIDDESYNDKLLDSLYDKVFDYYSNNDGGEYKYIPFDETILKSLTRFKLDKANVSIYDYIKILISNQIDVEIKKAIMSTKDKLASVISEAVFDNDKVTDKKGKKNNNEKFYFTSEMDILSDSQLLTKSGIPLRNRGDGFQMIVKNAIFRLLSEQEVHGTSTIFAFEEPEIHLHPDEQRQLYRTLKKLSANHNYQIIITTHSPFLVKELSLDDNNIIVVKSGIPPEGTKIINLNQSNERCIKIKNYYSLNEINYIAFEEPTVEYHIELFGYIQNKLIEKHEPNVNANISSVDSWFSHYIPQDLIFYDTRKIGNPDQPERRTLPYCIRNWIDHPLTKRTIIDHPSNLQEIEQNRINNLYNVAFENNKEYDKVDIRKKSIDLMRDEIIKKRPDIFDEVD